MGGGQGQSKGLNIKLRALEIHVQINPKLA